MSVVNISSLSQIVKSSKPELSRAYLERHNASLKVHEYDDLHSFVNQLRPETNDLSLLNKFHLSYVIPQIGKEFDLIKLDLDKAINIELKSKSNLSKIERQLRKNYYYLKGIRGDVDCYTYVSATNKIYKFDGTVFTSSTAKDIIASLKTLNMIYEGNLNDLFNPSEFLISPFNTTERFLRQEYFLTDQQESFKENIINDYNTGVNKFASIYGVAGTGKTILTYDIARTLIQEGKNICIVHCGNLNDGHLSIRKNEGWNIYGVKEFFNNMGKNPRLYDVLIIDEAQRLYEYQFDYIESKYNKYFNMILFSHDINQRLSDSDMGAKLTDRLTHLMPKEYELSKKIRTNKEIGSFIQNIFDRKKTPVNLSYDNIEISYFDNLSDVKKHIEDLDCEGWKYINFSSSLHNNEPFDKYNNYTSPSPHKVIGQEYDNVAVVVDRNFRYNSNKELIYAEDTYYLGPRMLHQIMTRTRKKLHVIVYDNLSFLENALEIING